MMPPMNPTYTYMYARPVESSKRAPPPPPPKPQPPKGSCLLWAQNPSVVQMAAKTLRGAGLTRPATVDIEASCLLVTRSSGATKTVPLREGDAVSLCKGCKAINSTDLKKGCHIRIVRGGSPLYFVAAADAERTQELYEALLALVGTKKPSNLPAGRSTSSGSDATAPLDGSLSSSEASVSSSLSSSDLSSPSSSISSSPAPPPASSASASAAPSSPRIDLEEEPLTGPMEAVETPVDPAPLMGWMVHTVARPAPIQDAMSHMAPGLALLLLLSLVGVIGFQVPTILKLLDLFTPLIVSRMPGMADAQAAIALLSLTGVTHAAVFAAHHLTTTHRLRLSQWAIYLQALVAAAGSLGGFTLLGRCAALPEVRGGLVGLLLVSFLKLFSFVAVSGTHRALAAAGTLGQTLRALSTAVGFEVGPISASNYAYFLAAPTLVYQPAYPRAPTNWGRVARLVMEVTVIGIVCGAISLCWLLPLLTAREHHIQAMDLGALSLHLPTLLGVAIPNTLTWVLGVGYGVFHVALSLLAELVGFADHCFYETWWESRDFKQFWRRWNLPVHQYCRVHVMPLCKALGLPILASYAVVFFLSAVAHELPLMMTFRTWEAHGAMCLFGAGFWAMMVQAPLSLVTPMVFPKTKTGAILGNLFFWVTFCWVIQSLVLLTVYRDFVLLG